MVSGGERLYLGNTVVVKGTLREVLEDMSKIKGVVLERKAHGWSPFQDDEVWRYHTQPDERVCPVCEDFGLTVRYAGDEIPSNFPDRVQRQAPTYTLVRPAVHKTYPELKWSISPDAVGGCRCWIVWINPEVTLAARLENEMRMGVL